MKNVVHIVGCVAISILLASGSAWGATKEDFCVQPAFIATGLEPNLLLMIDNSASMYDLAYTGTSSTACYDNSYDNTADYIGYFSKLDAEGNIAYPVYQYTYNSATPADSKFVEVASVPTTGGTYRTSYLYIEMTGTKGATDRKVSSIIASGRFLNWLSASKFDSQKQVLTGGKYDTGRQFLIGESRGCVGRRFVREVLPTAWTHATLTTNPITFAIRGPNAVEPLYNPDTQGGKTRIEIYEADFNQTACNTAAENWIAGNYGTAQTQTGNCLDISGAGNTATGRTLSTFNHTMQTCWQLKGNIRNGAITADAIWQGINITDVTGACEKVYTTDGINSVDITDDSDGKYVCTSAPIATHLAPIVPWNVLGSDETGYLGKCWQGTASKFTGNDACVKRELLHYCMGQEYSEVIDPSSTATTGGGIPAVLIDAGVRAIGDPIGPVGSDSVNTFLYAHVAATPPSGLLQKYGTSIRIGAMSFNNIGSASETMPGTVLDPNKDAGKIVSFIGAPGVCSVTTTTTCSNDLACPSAEVCNFAGSHSVGLVNAVGGIVANTWTPFTEAYYNAIGYYVKDAIATNSSLSSTKFTPSAAAIAAPIAGTDDFTNKNPILARCQSNYVLMISDGGSTADQNSDMKTKITDVSNYFRDPATLAETGATSGVCGIYNGSPYLHDLSYFAKHRNIFQPAVSCASGSCDNAQTITTIVVYTGPETSPLTGVCDPKTQMELTATNGGTTLYTPSNPTQFFTVLRDALSGLVARAASGTAASILSNSEGSGANILQAVFFPKKYFDNETASNWIGEMLNLWYFVDPYINNSTIREDTNEDLKLNLISDYVARFMFDSASDRTMVQLYSDNNGDGTGDTAIGSLIDPDDVKTIWRAGRLLWERDLSASPRKLYTPMIAGGTEISGTGLMTFTYGNIGSTVFADNSAVLQPYLQYPISDPVSINNDQAVKLMQWVHGFDFPGDNTIRSRTVKSGNIPAAAVSTVDTDTYVTNPRDKGIGVWKLGDIISSTPRLQSTVRLNTYDLPKPGGYNDKSYESYVHSNEYANRGMVYVGANDGMLHAFKLGTLSVKATGFQKASLTGTNLGKEEWSFIPKNFLPYLKYLSDPAYAHQYSVDGRTVIFDASIGDTNTGTCIESTYWECPKLTNSSVVTTANNLDPAKNTWRTVVIGGMGLGGASRSSCTGDVACVQTPMLDPADTSKSLGYSSYFALDVTDPSNPKLLWEFNNNQLGFATTGPAIVRVGPADKNGRWFAVFGSGPFGKIESQQFKGNSDHHLRFFIVDLRTGVLVKTITTDIDNAFAGAMLGGSIDADRWNNTVTGNYQDDAIYVGYTKEVSGSWTGGGVGRIMIKPVTSGQPDSTYINDTSNFKWTKVIDDIGPVTTSIARLQDKSDLNKDLWLFFGTGRYYYRDSVSIDDRDSQRALFGIKEPCYNTDAKPGNYLDPTCTAAQSGTIVDQTSSVLAVADTDGGWRIDLDRSTTAGVDGATTSEGSERVVTDTVALTNGSVFFTTFKPSLDVCGYGGNSYLWGVKYNTGGQAAANALQGKALIQLSSGEFKEVDLSTAFTGTGTKLNRRMATPMTGKPPSDAPPIVSNSQNRPVKKILHIKEH